MFGYHPELILATLLVSLTSPTFTLDSPENIALPVDFNNEDFDGPIKSDVSMNSIIASDSNESSGIIHSDESTIYLSDGNQVSLIDTEPQGTISDKEFLEYITVIVLEDTSYPLTSTSSGFRKSVNNVQQHLKEREVPPRIENNVFDFVRNVAIALLQEYFHCNKSHLTKSEIEQFEFLNDYLRHYLERRNKRETKLGISQSDLVDYLMNVTLQVSRENLKPNQTTRILGAITRILRESWTKILNTTGSEGKPDKYLYLSNLTSVVLKDNDLSNFEKVRLVKIFYQVPSFVDKEKIVEINNLSKTDFRNLLVNAFVESMVNKKDVSYLLQSFLNGYDLAGENKDSIQGVNSKYSVGKSTGKLEDGTTAPVEKHKHEGSHHEDDLFNYEVELARKLLNNNRSWVPEILNRLRSTYSFPGKHEDVITTTVTPLSSISPVPIEESESGVPNDESEKDYRSLLHDFVTILDKLIHIYQEFNPTEQPSEFNPIKEPYESNKDRISQEYTVKRNQNSEVLESLFKLVSNSSNQDVPVRRLLELLITLYDINHKPEKSESSVDLLHPPTSVHPPISTTPLLFYPPTPTIPNLVDPPTPTTPGLFVRPTPEPNYDVPAATQVPEHNILLPQQQSKFHQTGKVGVSSSLTHPYDGQINAQSAQSSGISAPIPRSREPHEMNYFKRTGNDGYVYGYGVNSQYDREEKSENGVTSGYYRVMLPDGRTQTVSYVADSTGYHPIITIE